MVTVGEGRKRGICGRVLEDMQYAVNAGKDEVVRRREGHANFGGEPRLRIANACGAGFPCPYLITTV